MAHNNLNERITPISSYRTIEDLPAYVSALLARGAQCVTAEKFARIAARQGMPGETVISWSADAQGRPVEEKKAVVAAEEATGAIDWIATKTDERGAAVVDRNGHKNEWIISDAVFRRKYEADPACPGLYRPVGGPQKFVRLEEGIHIRQWGEEWNVGAGGYINVTKESDLYVISGRDFEDTYRIVANGS